MSATAEIQPNSGGWGPRSSFDRVLSALEQGGYEPTKIRRADFFALCPGHSESTASLHVTYSSSRGVDGKVLLNCQAQGCHADPASILEPLGLTMLDLFDSPPPTTHRVGRSPRARQAGADRGKIGPLPKRRTKPVVDHEHEMRVVESYPYTDDDGAIVQEVVRKACTQCGTKEFVQHFASADGEMVGKKPAGFVPVLYRQPAIRDAVAHDEEVYLLEGEKDVHTAEDHDLVAATNTGGARSFTPELAAHFTGGRVRVVLDRDAAGWARGLTTHDQLRAAGAAEVLLLLPAPTAPKSDFTDHIEAGHGIGDLIPVSYDDVRIWDAVARVDAAAQKIQEALDEAQFHCDQAESRRARAPKTADEHVRFATRWAIESELQWEKIADAADEYSRISTGRKGDWAQEATRLAERLLTQSTAIVQATHTLVSRAVPDGLLERSEMAIATVRSAAAAPAISAETITDTGDDAEIVDLFPTRRGGGGGGGGRSALRSEIERKEFALVEGCIVQVKWVAQGRGEDLEYKRKLTLMINLDLHLDGREYIDDSADAEDEEIEARATQMSEQLRAEKMVSHYIFSYTDPASRERISFRVSEDRVRSGDFLDNIPVSGLQFDHTKSGKARVVEAVRAVSTDAVDSVQYRGTGWRLDPTSGWSYVHFGGLITSDGVKPGHQLLTGPLSRYLLPAPTTNVEELRHHFLEHSATFMDRFAPRVSAVLLGLMYVAPLKRCQYSVVVQGSPGSVKSGLCALAMHHLGTAWDRSRATISMTGNGSTINAVRIITNAAKDSVVFFDDVTPGANAGAAQARLGEIIQMMFNQDTRDRSERDGHLLRAGQIPRGSALFSSELMPVMGANARRAVIVPLQRGELSMPDIIELDRPESRMARASLTASYLAWAARDLPETRRGLRAELDRYADTMREAGRTNEEADASSHFWAGWATMTLFLQEIGALTPDERAAWLTRAHEGIIDALDAAKDPDSPTNVGARLREVMASGLQQGLAHVTDVRTGDAPADEKLAIRLGWRRVTLGPGYGGEPPKTKIESSGKRVGFVNFETDELLIDSSSLEAFVKASAASLSAPFTMDAGTIRRALHEADILKAQWENGKTGGRYRYTMKRTIHCESSVTRPGRSAERTMTVLRLSALLGDEPGDTPIDGREIPPAPLPEQPTGDTGSTDDAPTSPDDQPTLEEAAQEQAPAPATASNDGEELTAMHDDTIDPTPSDDDAVVVQMLATATPCQLCGTPARTAVDDVAIHPRCWGQLCADPSLLASRAATSAPTARVLAAAPTHEQPATAPTTKRPARTPATGRFTAAAAVVDTDLIYLPDGTTRPTPHIAHLGHIAQLAYDLNLGTQVLAPSRGVRGRTDTGVVVLTAELADTLDIQTSGILREGENRGTAFANAHTAHPALQKALTDGWSTVLPADGSDPSIKVWTKLWATEGERRDSVFVTFLPLLSDTLRSGEAGPAQVAHRLGEFARLMGTSWHLSGQTTGHDLMVALRVKAREEFVVHDVPTPAKAIGDPDFDWSRPPTAEELELEFVHAYDRGGSHLAGVAGLELPVGDYTEYRDGTAFDPTLPGYWKIEMPAAADWRHPHPLAKPRDRAVEWVTTPSLAYAHELGYEPNVVEAVVWHEHARVLDPWYARIRDARQATDNPDDPELAILRDMIKETYTRSIGMMGSEQHLKGRNTYYPERRHMIIAKARTNLLRAVVRIGNETGRWPLAVKTDTIVYASNDPDPITAWPGADLANRPLALGRGLGQYKVEGTGKLADQLEFLVTPGAKWAPDAKSLITGKTTRGGE
jgi:hypothetical protein